MSTTPINFGDLYHTGIVVSDVDRAKVEYSELFGVTWGLEGEAEMPVWLPGGAHVVNFKFAYTNEGPHRLELVQAIDDTLWSVSGIGQAHHLGYWCDDVTTTSKALERRGMPLAAKIGVNSKDDESMFVMHQLNSGAYIELVSAAVREHMFPSS